MPCYYPMHGYRAKSLNASGKRSIVFNPSNGFKDLPVTVACGQCIGCRLERSRQWAVRLVHEAQLHEHSAFLTLTYDPKNLPENGSLQKSDFQKFMKSYRKRYAHIPIRYFFCGEYGDRLERPHYHALIFGHDFHDKKHWATIGGNKLYRSKRLERIWKHGYSLIGNITFESAAYVARYVTKKINGKNKDDHYGTVINKDTGEITFRRCPEFAHGSNGLGKKWFDKFHTDVFPFDEVSLRGKTFKPPRYYSRLYEALYPDDFAKIRAARIAASKNNPDNTYERLRVRERIQELNFQQLTRTLEK